MHNNLHHLQVISPTENATARIIKSNKNATHAPTSTQTPCNNNQPAHTTTSTPRDKHARKGYCEKKLVKIFFFAKYRHIMLFLQNIPFPKKSVTDLRDARRWAVTHYLSAGPPPLFAHKERCVPY
jgi:hypothetical protein